MTASNVFGSCSNHQVKRAKKTTRNGGKVVVITDKNA